MILEGIRVLDFTQYLAGPTVTRFLAEMGAEVIKIEQAPEGDPARVLPAMVDRRSGYFVQQNRGKQSLCLDVKAAQGQAIVAELATTVDVVVENFGPGVMSRRGWDYAALQALNPKIIMASISAFGRNSPLAHLTGYDWIAQAFSGIMHMTGPRDAPPHPVGVGVADISSGVHAACAIGYALFYRERTGKGQYIDISMVDTMFSMHDVNVQVHALTAGEFEPHRMGYHHELVTPTGVFQGPEGYIVVMALDRQWQAFCAALEQPELEHDPRFTDNAQRAKNQTALIPIIETWMQTFQSDQEVLARLEEYRIPSAPVLSPADALEHPYFSARGAVQVVHDPILGEFPIPGFPLRFSAQPEPLALVAPLLGEHNDRILSEVLGYSASRIQSLSDAGVLMQGDR